MKSLQLDNRSLLITAILIASVTLSQETRAGSLIAYYPFDGNGNDASGDGYNLDLHGGVGFASGLFGQALDLHHNNSQFAQRPVSDAALNFGSSDFTVQIWAKFNSTSGEQVLMEKWDGASGPGWTLTKVITNPFFGTSALRFATSFAPGGLLNSPTLNITTGVWHDIVIRRSGSSFIMDFDNKVVATATSSSAIAAATDPLLIGRRDPGDGRDFSVNGRLDEAAIWSNSLSDADVATLWNGGRGTPAIQVSTVAEPSGVLLLVLGLGLVGASRRGRKSLTST